MGGASEQIVRPRRQHTDRRSGASVANDFVNYEADMRDNAFGSAFKCEGKAAPTYAI